MLRIWGAAIMAGSILCALQAATGPPASALDWQIEFANDTRMAVVEIYASPVGTGRWGQDLLGNDILPSASSVVINIDDAAGYCRFDLKTVFDDGTIRVRRDINVCALERYAISYR
jgi:hypothetical protein